MACCLNCKKYWISGLCKKKNMGLCNLVCQWDGPGDGIYNDPMLIPKTCPARYCGDYIKEK